jgi:hypothetical protein
MDALKACITTGPDVVLEARGLWASKLTNKRAVVKAQPHIDWKDAAGG